jgi:general secretion pathway protein G
MKLSKAFTMIEMMVVLMIIGFIAAIVIPQVAKYMRSATEAKMQLKMSTIKAALMAYRMDFGAYPTSRDGGLRALVENPRPNDEEYRKAEREGKWPYITGGEKGIIAENEEFIYNNPPEKFKNKYHYYEIIWIGRGTEDEPAMDIGE